MTDFLFRFYNYAHILQSSTIIKAENEWRANRAAYEFAQKNNHAYWDLVSPTRSTTKYYLAYGSNLNKQQMLYRCPHAVPIATTVLEDYRITFRGNFRWSGVANIEPRKGSSVPVGIWKITAKCEKELDRYEGFPRLYTKQMFTLNVNGQILDVMAYVMTEGHQWCQPSRSYFNTIKQGYKDFGITNTRKLTYAATHPVKGDTKE